MTPHLVRTAQRRAKGFTIRAIADKAAFHTGVDRGQIAGSTRAAAIIRARFAVYWSAIKLGQTVSQIGRALSRDHSTIISGVRRAEAMRGRDPAFRMLTDRLVREISGEE